MTDNPKKVYLEGYAAFDQGRFSDAVALATRCLAMASPDSYWHFGALGLRCWAANCLGNNTSVERDADALLGEDAGSEKPWFDGLALLNLGLVRYRAGRTTEAKELFAQASARYSAHKIDPEHPSEWQLVSEFFVAVTRLAASGEVDKMKRLAEKLASLQVPDKEMEHLSHAVGLYQRHARNEDVRAEAMAAAQKGVSRALLAIIMLEVKNQ